MVVTTEGAHVTLEAHLHRYGPALLAQVDHRACATTTGVRTLNTPDSIMSYLHVHNESVHNKSIIKGKEEERSKYIRHMLQA